MYVCIYVYVCNAYMYSMTFFIQNYSSVVAEFPILFVQYAAGFEEYDKFKKQGKIPNSLCMTRQGWACLLNMPGKQS